MVNKTRLPPAQSERRQYEARALAPTLRELFSSTGEARVSETQKKCKEKDAEIAALEAFEADLKKKIANMDAELEALQEMRKTDGGSKVSRKFACTKCPVLAGRVQALQLEFQTLDQEKARRVRLLSTAEAERQRLFRRDFKTSLDLVSLQTRYAAAEDRERALGRQLKGAYEKLAQLQKDREETDKAYYRNGATTEYLQLLNERFGNKEVNVRTTPPKSTFCLEDDAPALAVPHSRDLYAELKRACRAERILNHALEEQVAFLEERRDGTTKAKELFEEIRQYLDTVHANIVDPQGLEKIEELEKNAEQRRASLVPDRKDSGMLRRTSVRATNAEMFFDAARRGTTPDAARERGSSFSNLQERAELDTSRDQAPPSPTGARPASGPTSAATREQREFATLVKQAHDAINFVWGKLQKQSVSAIELLDRANKVLEEHRLKPAIESTLIAQTERFENVIGKHSTPEPSPDAVADGEPQAAQDAGGSAGAGPVVEKQTTAGGVTGLDFTTSPDPGVGGGALPMEGVVLAAQRRSLREARRDHSGDKDERSGA